MTVYLVYEDLLSEVVMKKMVSATIASETDFIPIGRHGKGYIRNRINEFNNTNDDFLFFVLADLDQTECAFKLIREYCSRPLRSRLLFRVAVREVESWLLADTEGFARFTNLGKAFVAKEAGNAEELDYPKEKLISIVSRSRSRELKSDIVRAGESGFRQGPGYNARMSDYVLRYWDVARARIKAPSLERALRALRELEIQR